MNDFQKASYLRNRARGFSCSDQLWEQIQGKTKGSISGKHFYQKSCRKGAENQWMKFLSGLRYWKN